MSGQDKPAQAGAREWWIEFIGHWPGKDIVHENNPHLDKTIHVIEKSAYDALKAERDESWQLNDHYRTTRNQLRKELDEAKRDFEDCNADRVRTAEELFAAAKERDQYRAALEGLLNDTQHADHDCGDERCPVRIARQALEGK